MMIKPQAKDAAKIPRIRPNDPKTGFGPASSTTKMTMQTGIIDVLSINPIGVSMVSSSTIAFGCLPMT